jgi:hypothetical protein
MSAARSPEGKLGAAAYPELPAGAGQQPGAPGGGGAGQSHAVAQFRRAFTYPTQEWVETPEQGSARRYLQQHGLRRAQAYHGSELTRPAGDSGQRSHLRRRIPVAHFEVWGECPGSGYGHARCHPQRPGFLVTGHDRRSAARGGGDR